MNAEFIESYNQLSDLKPGDVAVSKDRERCFVCGYHIDAESGLNVEVILEVNHLYNQYTDKRDNSQPVKILGTGDKFIFSI
jgi:uncharacterized Fe-S cluster-containing MiaB family protein